LICLTASKWPKARANLERYLRVDKKYWFDDFREQVEIMINPDPGDESMASDAEWDEWICMDHDPSRDVIETEALLWDFQSLNDKSEIHCRPL
jgi:hypothetical protein